jgi:hypothetical protein
MISTLILGALGIVGSTIDIGAEFNSRPIADPARLNSVLHLEAGLNDGSGRRLLWPEFETSALRQEGILSGTEVTGFSVEYFLRGSAGQSVEWPNESGGITPLDFRYSVSGSVRIWIPGPVTLEPPGPRAVSILGDPISISWNLIGPTESASGTHVVSIRELGFGQMTQMGEKPGELATFLWGAVPGDEPWWQGTVEGIPFQVDGRIAGSAVIVPEPDGFEVLLPGILTLGLVYARLIRGCVG